MHKISYRFEHFEAMSQALDAEDTDLELSCQGVIDGQWLLATFLVGGDSTSVAGRVVDRGDALRLRFEERDRQRLRDFASGNIRPSMRPPALEEPASLPPNSSALVVSGSAAVGSIVNQLLESWGARAQTVGSVEEALDSLRSRAVDFIVLDSALPGLNCEDLCRALSRTQRDERPCVLLLGQDPCCADALAALAAGADDFVQKPFRAQELRARLVGLLEHRERLCG